MTLSTTVVNVETERGWYYNSCKICSKKVTPDGSGYYCEKCDDIVSSDVPRFMVELRVIDDTVSTVFVVFDRAVS